MQSKNTLIALIVAIVLAIVSFVVLTFVGLSGEQGLGKPVENGFYLQESATPVMDELTFVYNLVSYIIGGIVAFVLGLMAYIMIRYREKANPIPSKTSHNTLIEVIWTVVPVLILIVIAIPSMNLLYKQDVIKDTEVTVKAVGNTWNWAYTYPDHENVEEISANQTGTFYGQCSEICGIKHYYMPIEVKVVSKADYAVWIANDGSFTSSVAENKSLMGSGQTAAQK